MGLLSCLQTINLYNIHIGKYANKKVNLLGPTVLDPTPVSYSFICFYSIYSHYKFFFIAD